MHMIVPMKSDTNVTEHSFNNAHLCQSLGIDTCALLIIIMRTLCYIRMFIPHTCMTHNGKAYNMCMHNVSTSSKNGNFCMQ